MIDHFVLSRAFLVTIVWQTTLALALGALSCIAWRRHPGRAHFCITLGLVGCVALPVAAMVVRHADWGLLPPGSHAAIASAPPAPAVAVTPVVPAQQPTTGAAPWNVTPWIGALWLGVSALLCLRLVVSLGYGVRLLATARPLVNERFYVSLESAAALLGMRRMPITFTTDAVRCPAIWCWAIHPALLLPSATVSGPERWSERQWLAVFSHELAHLRRRDHFAAIVAEAICALLWWQPLVWWSRARLNELGDEACDRWVVATGHAPDVYAETLLDMIPQRRSLTALSMVSGKRGLGKRVAAILNAALSAPDIGRWWAAANVVAASCLVLVVACTQTQAPPQTPAGDSVGVLVLANPSMEAGSAEPDSWNRDAAVDGVEYVWDHAVAKTGRASLCLRKTAQRYFPIAQWTQTLSLPVADHPQRVQLSGWVKAEQAYKAILDVQFTDAQGKWSHKWAGYIGAREPGDPPANHDWRLYSGEVDVPAGTTNITVGLQIYGPGTVWFDDVELVPVDTPPGSEGMARSGFGR